MFFEKLIQGLSRPAAFPQAVKKIDIIETHISVVFLAGDHVYKIKKPVQYSFIDYSTLEKRHFFCEEEIRLNRRLAPELYLGVVPVCQERGHPHFEGNGELVEWAVKMKRFPESSTFLSHLKNETLQAFHMHALSNRLELFFRKAPRGQRAIHMAGSNSVLNQALENLEQCKGIHRRVLHPKVYRQLVCEIKSHAGKLSEIIDQRAPLYACDGHGDLRLEHVIWSDKPGETPGINVVDTVEFDPDLRLADPLKDIAFLMMELEFEGRADLAHFFLSQCMKWLGDPINLSLVNFYIVTRHLVRGKIRAMQPGGSDRSTAHFLSALFRLLQPLNRPCLVLIGGLPASGKSSLAADLKTRANFEVVSTDHERKKLLQVKQGEKYSPRNKRRVYDTCLGLTETRLRRAGRVIVDASFQDPETHQIFKHLANRLHLPLFTFFCQVSPETARQRLADRHKGESDADWDIFKMMWSEQNTRPRQSDAGTQWLRRDAPTGELLARAMQCLEEANCV